MEIGKKFNQLTIEEYYPYIDNYKDFEDFNTLGLYRSLVENERLSLNEKIMVREYAHKTFKKAFDFLQLKDPSVFVAVSTLGIKNTKADYAKIWEDVKKNQQKILSDKKIRHRNFGTYSKHNCPFKDCVWNGLMIRQGSSLAEASMHFLGDKNPYPQKVKSDKRRSERKKERKLVNKELEME
ncbi:hypothetical protein [Mucilaginibacter sp.]|uniref:hypothetical protein n=1 Tax=Mucilaginibacter sp. TaxID=1882438 RepID=UPI003D0FA1CC